MILFRGQICDANNSTTFGNRTLAVGKIWMTEKDDRGVGTQGGGPPGVSTDKVVPGVATLA